MYATRWAHFRRQLLSRFTVYALLAAVALGLAAAVIWDNPLALALVPAGAALLLAGGSWLRAGEIAADEFFAGFAPTIGLDYVDGTYLDPITPLLSAGETQECEHAMEGPLFGRLGGPRCTLTHFSFKVSHPGDQGGTRQVSHPFTVCSLEIPGALPLFKGVYLRRRPQIRIPGIWDDWLERARAQEVDLESTDFEEAYQLKVARDQERLWLHELFSPSFIVWLAEHPLRPGFECKAGTLVVFVPGHEGDPDRLTLFHEATREIARRVMAAVASPRAAAAPTAT